MEDFNLFIVNSLNFCRKHFSDKLCQLYLFIGPFTSKRSYPSGWSTKFKNLIWILIQDFMASSHLMESGPIIASLYVIGSQLFNNNSQSSNLSFDYAFNQFSDIQQIFRCPVFTTPCRHKSHECHSRLRNSFRYCATLIILLMFNNLIKFYCPPTKIQRETPTL